MSGEFIAQYIQECISNGFQKIIDIRHNAEVEIKQISERIKEIDELRTRQNLLRAVVRHLGGSVKVNNAPGKTMDFSIPWSDLEQSFKQLCFIVCNIIKNNNNGVFPAQIMSEAAPICNLELHEQRAVYSAIKWLHLNKVLDRQDNGMIVCGKEFNSFLETIE